MRALPRGNAAKAAMPEAGATRIFSVLIVAICSGYARRARLIANSSFAPVRRPAQNFLCINSEDFIDRRRSHANYDTNAQNQMLPSRNAATFGAALRAAQIPHLFDLPIALAGNSKNQFSF
jgi:hypothetical protein